MLSVILIHSFIHSFIDLTFMSRTPLRPHPERQKQNRGSVCPLLALAPPLPLASCLRLQLRACCWWWYSVGGWLEVSIALRCLQPALSVPPVWDGPGQCQCQCVWVCPPLVVVVGGGEGGSGGGGAGSGLAGLAAIDVFLLLFSFCVHLYCTYMTLWFSILSLIFCFVQIVYCSTLILP